MVSPRPPASIRNQNPGAMYPGASSRKYGSTSFETLRSGDGVHKIAAFPDHESGAAAMFDLLDRSYTGKTIEQAIRQWCGGYHLSTYLRVLERQTGIVPADILTKELVRDVRVAVPLCRAMAFQEAGRNYPLTEEEWEAAHALAVSRMPALPAATPVPSIAPIHEAEHAVQVDGWEPTNDLPTPKSETRAAAELKQSRKWALSTIWSRAQAVALAAALAAFDYVRDNPELAIGAVLGLLLIGFLVTETLKHLQRQDIAEGVYTPRGDE